MQEIRKAGIKKKHLVQEEIDALMSLIDEKRMLIGRLMAVNAGNSEGVVDQETCGIGDCDAT